MKPGDTNKPDHGLEQDLQQIDQQYQALERDEPPAMLDQAILNKARQAVEAHPVNPWNFGWMHASATAAVLVIGLTLVLQQRSEVPGPPSEAEMNAPAASDMMLQNMESRLQEDMNTGEPEEVDALGKVESLDAEFRSLDDRSADKDRLDQAADAPATTGIEREPLEQSRRERALKAQQTSLPEEEAAQSVITSHAGNEAPARPKEDKRANQAVDEQPVSGAVSTAAPAPATTPATELVTEKAEEGFAAVADLSETDGMALSTETMLNAEDWLAHILELKNAGAETQWRQELEAFIATYPEYQLPEELSSERAKPAEGDDGGE